MGVAVLNVESSQVVGERERSLPILTAFGECEEAAMTRVVFPSRVGLRSGLGFDRRAVGPDQSGFSAAGSHG
jgi:hypothetical protein